MRWAIAWSAVIRRWASARLGGAGLTTRANRARTAFGTVTGLYIHATLAIAGLSALVMHSSQAFTAIKLIGAGYLIGLGIWTWRSAAPNTAPVPYRQRLPKGADCVYAQALLANVLNPKAAAIYLTLAPSSSHPTSPSVARSSLWPPPTRC
ncbi:LysE family transporter [Streptomyces sp. NBC_01351]